MINLIGRVKMFNGDFISKSLGFILCFLLGVFLCLIFCVGPINAAEVKLGWDKSVEPDVIGYKIRYGNESGKYEAMIDVPSNTLVDGENPSYTVENLLDGRFYFFVATAYDTGGLESLYSNEVMSDDGLPPAAPKNMCIIVIVVGN